MTTEPKDSIDVLVGVLILRRKTLNLNITEVAEDIGVPRNKLSAMENGLIDPPARVLERYAKRVGLELEWNLHAAR